MIVLMRSSYLGEKNILPNPMQYLLCQNVALNVISSLLPVLKCDFKLT
jgi:hypothetical protein